MPPIPFQCYTRPAAAEFLSKVLGRTVTIRVMHDHARRGDGPPYRMLNGRSIYHEADLVEWARQAGKPPKAKASRMRFRDRHVA